MERAIHLPNNEQQGGKHAKGLKRVGENERLNAAAPRVEPDESHHQHHGEGKRNVQRVEHKPLQHHADDAEFDGRAQDFRQQKETCTRLIGLLPQARLQITIDGGEVEPIVNRQQHKGHHHIAHGKAQAHLQIGELRGDSHAGHADKRDTRNGGAHHAKGYQRPRRLPVAPIKSVVGGMACGEPTQNQKRAKINEKCD